MIQNDFEKLITLYRAMLNGTMGVGTMFNLTKVGLFEVVENLSPDVVEKRLRDLIDRIKIQITESLEDAYSDNRLNSVRDISALIDEVELDYDPDEFSLGYSENWDCEQLEIGFLEDNVRNFLRLC